MNEHKYKLNCTYSRYVEMNSAELRNAITETLHNNINNKILDNEIKSSERRNA